MYGEIPDSMGCLNTTGGHGTCGGDSGGPCIMRDEVTRQLGDKGAFIKCAIFVVKLFLKFQDFIKCETF